MNTLKRAQLAVPLSSLAVVAAAVVIAVGGIGAFALPGMLPSAVPGPAAPSTIATTAEAGPTASTITSATSANTPPPSVVATTTAPSPVVAPATTTTAPPTTKAPPPKGSLAAWASERYSMTTGPNRTSRVVLTYDDCPTSRAAFKAMVLGAEQQGVALVMFPTGNCIASGLFDAGFARAHGHYVFNHSNTHPQFTHRSASAIAGELGSPGVRTTWGRPPYGEVNATIKSVYAGLGMRIWLWTIDTRDWDGHRPQDQVVAEILAQATKSSTVLMHMQEHAFNPEALAQIKAGLAAKGLGLCRNQGPTDQFPKTLTC